MSKLIEAQEEVYTTIARYANVIDRLYAMGPDVQRVLAQIFGTQHSPLVTEAYQWIAQNKLQAMQQAEKLAKEQEKMLDGGTKKVG